MKSRLNGRENIYNIIKKEKLDVVNNPIKDAHCLLYTSPSPRDRTRSRMPSSA